jgi:hypothetical protein
MAKTIDQLTLLSTLPDDSDLLPISDNGVTKRVASGVLKSDCLRTVSNTVTVPDATNFALNATTGTKLGTDATQKLAFWNATPVDQPALTADLLDSLQEVGLIAVGAGNTPLNLSSGPLTCGPVNCSTLAASSNATVGGNATIGGNLSANGDMTFGEGANVVAGTATGSKIGTATTQKLGFWNATPAVQPTAIANITTTATTGTLPTADNTVTIANAATPTVVELLDYCVELEAKIEDLFGKLRTIGIIAT